MATPEETDQQRRVILETKDDTKALLEVLMRLHARMDSYVRLGLGDDQILDPDAFTGTGTTIPVFRSAITSLGAIETLLVGGHGTNLEKFAR